eukprot:1876385-Rhodomonas_salina.2
MSSGVRLYGVTLHQREVGSSSSANWCRDHLNAFRVPVGGLPGSIEPKQQLPASSSISQFDVDEGLY